MNGWTNIVDDAYAELRNDSKTTLQVSKELPIEALRYYAASLFWLRTISLKLWQGHELTPPEVDLQRTFEGKTFVLPDPIHLGLKAVGINNQERRGACTPVPPTPATVLNRIPGLLGHVDAENHNVYEDYPVVGIAYQGCIEEQPEYWRAHMRQLQHQEALLPTETYRVSTLSKP